MPDPGEIGKRVRYWRLRRNLGRKQFADMIGRSTSWLDKIETGERDLTRIPTIELVAEALSVDPDVLTDTPTAIRAADCVDATEVSAIRSALGRYPSLVRPAHEPPAVGHLARQAEYLDHAWASSHFTTIAQHLPTLLEAAQTATLTAAAADQVDTHRILVTSYRLASSMLLKFESHDLAWLAADRAMYTALEVDDMWSQARATRSVARAMTAARQRAEAIDALLGMTDRMRPEVPRYPNSLLALYGMLYLAAAISAAEQDDAALAMTMHQEATQAAERMEPHHDDHRTYFGRTNVAIHRVSALVRLYEAEQALHLAATIPTSALSALSPERRANHLLDLAQANTHRGKYAEATRALAQAERTAPQEVRCRPVVHNLLRTLLSTTTGEPARQARQIADRAGVPA
ncbi:helix-turn-helix transcriptional regulator [Actinosynnema sp. NPDC047251]|uniref:Transcriptional regulator, XRE family n=1 Tax=Saccharothrix espanaensis (strain ATCC 51144 / DSM 44229 / JCM 9112 / NBRC 15066 / NRRL 15764) TaxID=1179773 RepID=K0K263_SACES|nr:helix-turn-helix transcriptional regulator [Saccharothrix espanaensis]CCH31647.1 Transcriptional regulator, XRE family [Saccharothrix espanaensis DSM 44229]